jgi:hypothetical protein
MPVGDEPVGVGCQLQKIGGRVIDTDIEDEPIPAPAPATVRKCGVVQWCAGMSLALHGVPDNSERKGLSVSRGWLDDAKHPKVIGVTYHAKARDPGIILNFCPWCGTRIRFDETPPPFGWPEQQREHQ